MTKLSAVTSIVYVKTDCAGNSKGRPVVLATPKKPNGLKVTGKRFHFNWRTPSAAGCHQLQVVLHDGTTLVADFRLTRSPNDKDDRDDDRDDKKRDRDDDRDDKKRDRDDDRRDRDEKNDRDRRGKGSRPVFRS